MQSKTCPQYPERKQSYSQSAHGIQLSPWLWLVERSVTTGSSQQLCIKEAAWAQFFCFSCLKIQTFDNLKNSTFAKIIYEILGIFPAFYLKKSFVIINTDKCFKSFEPNVSVPVPQWSSMRVGVNVLSLYWEAKQSKEAGKWLSHQ